MVIDTDYDNYAILVRCQNYGFFNRENIWVLSRNRPPTDDENAAIAAALARHSINSANLVSMDNGCPPGDPDFKGCAR
ncbi:lopap-like isoform X2 [Oratosquilla oratoria]|uniref:lopap-like isoform X2 n=1 Tax=Oratosquilla oratoria TaxID=337810 RepID=UPI003F76AD8B